MKTSRTVRPLIVYGTGTCPRCDEVVIQLQQWHVVYELRDLFGFQGALEDVLKNVGYTFHLPIFRLGASIVVGHDILKLKSLLQSEGYSDLN
jgi:hypothetical protein